MSAISRSRVIAELPYDQYPAFIARAKTIAEAMSAATTSFPAANPPLATVESQIAILETEQQKVVARLPGAVAARDAQAAIVRSSVESLRGYVQSLCDASPALATTLIAAAGMKLAAAAARSKPVLAASQGPVSGTVRLRANRTVLMGKTSHGGFFNWEWSADGKTWTSAPSTTKSETVLTGLTPALTLSFRVSATTSKGPGDWSQVVTLLVH